MPPWEFKHTYSNGMNSYYFVASKGSIIGRHWPPEKWHEWRSDGPTPLTEYAVTGANQSVVVYLGLAWRLTAGLTRYGVATFNRDLAANILKREPIGIHWEYTAEPMELGQRKRYIGFCLAREIARDSFLEAPSRHQYMPMAGMFELKSFQDLVGLGWAVSMDNFGEINLFAIETEDDRSSLLTRYLQGKKKPSLVQILGDNDIFLDICIGYDLGYDSLIIISRKDISSQIENLIDDYAKRIEIYEKNVDEAIDMPSFLKSLRGLSGIFR